MKRFGLRMACMAIALITLFSACRKKTADYGTLAVNMTDSPGNYYQVNVEITRVDVHLSGGNNWVALSSNAGIYNLLNLQNNVTAVLATGTSLPVGKIDQLRLILGTHNSVMLLDSTMHPLTIPSALNTGIKINVDATIPVNSTVTVVLDYDANASVNKDGNGNYQMNPVIKVKSIQ